MQGTVGRIVLGFIAAVISVLIVHQAIVYLLGDVGYIPGACRGPCERRPWPEPWRAHPRQHRVLGRPVGHPFCAHPRWLPGGMEWLKGLIFGSSSWSSATGPCCR